MNTLVENRIAREGLLRPRSGGPTGRYLLIALLLVAITAGSGCAFHYYDKETNTEHLWGFGHLKARISPVEEGVCVQASEVESVGLALNAGQEDYGLSAGYNRLGRMVVSTNAAARVEWYYGNLFHARAGTNFPFEPAIIHQIEPRQIK